MKKIIRGFVSALLIATMILGMTGCTTKTSKINDTILEFEYACQNLDVEAMLNCIDPDISDNIRLGLALVSTFAEVDYEDLVEGLFDELASAEHDSSFDAEEFLSTISITDIDAKAKKDRATVTCKTNFELAGEQFSRDTTIEMIEKDDKWYIYSFDMFSSYEE